jgi:hypothetical protein
MRRFALLITCLAFAAGTAACGDDKDDSAEETSSSTSSSTTTTTADESEEAEKEAEVVRFDREVQAELIAVGCYKGAEDGIIGPETDAAIKEFQSAEGLEVDGEVGTETSAALTKAASEGRKVCGATPASTTTTTKSTTTAKPTTTASGGGSAACTATALMEGLPAEGETIGHYVCSEGWAGGTLTDGTPFILESQSGRWYAPSQDPCGSASAGISPEVLEAGCPKG